jgi:lysozyme
VRVDAVCEPEILLAVPAGGCAARQAEGIMATVNRRALDISHHNEVSSWEAVVGAGIVGVIHKATEGTSYKDPDYLPRCAPALRAGLCWGAYHFANGSDVAAQVDHFLSVVGVDDETLYALDWEDDPNGNTMTLEQATHFLELIGRKIGENRCVIYSGNTAKQALGERHDPYLGEHRLWLAQYSNDPVAQVTWDKIWLWQYSDGNVGPQPHGCPGVTGDVDTNSWSGSDQQLRDEWTGAGPLPLPPTKQATVSITTTGDVKVTVNGREV